MIIRLVLDTNIVISSILTRGLPYFIVQLVFKKKVELVLSPILLEEYTLTIRRPKFKKVQRAGHNIIKELGNLATMVHPEEKIDYIQADLSDNRVLECAVVGDAQYIVTGNKKHFSFSQFKGVKIVNPEGFIAAFGSQILE